MSKHDFIPKMSYNEENRDFYVLKTFHRRLNGQHFKVGKVSRSSKMEVYGCSDSVVLEKLDYLAKKMG